MAARKLEAFLYFQAGEYQPQAHAPVRAPGQVAQAFTFVWVGRMWRCSRRRRPRPAVRTAPGPIAPARRQLRLPATRSRCSDPARGSPTGMLDTGSGTRGR
jgi:hypothetical protein